MSRATFAPKAGPTGGAGFALPASNASLMMPVTAKSEDVVCTQVTDKQACGLGWALMETFASFLCRWSHGHHSPHAQSCSSRLKVDG